MDISTDNTQIKKKSTFCYNITFLIFGLSVYFNVGFYTPLACHIVGNNYAPIFVFFIHFSRFTIKIMSLLLLKRINEFWYLNFFVYTTIIASISFVLFLPSGNINEYMQHSSRNSDYVKLLSSALIILNGFCLGLGEIAFLSYAKQFKESCVHFWNIGSGLAGLVASLYVLLLLWITDLIDLMTKKYIILGNIPVYITAVICYYSSLRSNHKTKKIKQSKATISKVFNILFVKLYAYSLPLMIGAMLYFIGLTGFIPSIKTYMEKRGNELQKKDATKIFTVGFTILRLGASLTKSLPYFLPFYNVHIIIIGHVLSLGLLITVSLTNRNQIILYSSLFGLGMSEGAIEGYVNSAVRNKAPDNYKKLALGYINISLVFGSSVGCLLGKLIYNTISNKLISS